MCAAIVICLKLPPCDTLSGFMLFFAFHSISEKLILRNATNLKFRIFDLLFHRQLFSVVLKGLVSSVDDFFVLLCHYFFFGQTFLRNFHLVEQWPKE